MTLKRGTIRRSLIKKGFVEETKTKHVRYRFYYRDIRTRVCTTVSRGSDNYDISNELVSEMANQCHLSVSDFRDLVKCSLSENDYFNLVKEHVILENDGKQP